MSFKVIENYYLFDLVNTNNKTNLKSSQIETEIEELRKELLEIFNWSNKGHIVFLPNPYYAKCILLSYFLNNPKFNSFKFFSNCKKREKYLFQTLAKIKTYSLSDFEALIKEENNKIVNWISLYEEEGLKDLKTVSKRVIKDKESLLIVELKKFETIGLEKWNAFVWNVMDGVTILGFSFDMELEPLVLGSNSVDYADETTLKIKKSFRNLEVGTSNIPLLLYLKETIKSKINRKQITYV